MRLTGQHELFTRNIADVSYSQNAYYFLGVDAPYNEMKADVDESWKGRLIMGISHHTLFATSVY